MQSSVVLYKSAATWMVQTDRDAQKPGGKRDVVSGLSELLGFLNCACNTLIKMIFHMSQNIQKVHVPL